jgi:hypothetical protein
MNGPDNVKYFPIWAYIKPKAGGGGLGHPPLTTQDPI